MRQKIELSKIRNISEITDDGLTFFKQNWKALLNAYFSICGFFWAAALIISVVNQLHAYQHTQTPASSFGAGFFTTTFFEVLNFTTLTLTTLSFITLYHQKGNQAPLTAEVWSYVKYYFFRVLITTILLGMLLAVGLVFCLIPGIYLWPVFSLILTIMVIENGSLQYSFNQGFKLINDNWGQVFSTLIVSLLLVAAAAILFSIPIAIIAGLIIFLTGINGAQVSVIAANISFHLIQFVYMYPLIALALVYYNLMERQEDNTLFKRISMLGKIEEQPDRSQSAEDSY